MDKTFPLAARMRPRTLEEFVGQGHIVGPGRLLRRAIQADQLSSLIFYGPPGTGKTTLATVIANTTRSHFITINAVLAGVKDIREAIEEARSRKEKGQRTLLFVDEVHRWNKAQQDALLPWVENGIVILIGATTENPYFSVNRPLVSRSRIFQLTPLTEQDLRAIARQALLDPERGYGHQRVDVAPDALDHLVNVANGDARGVLNALELAVETTLPDHQGIIRVDRPVAEESIQKRAVLYDRDGDIHYDTISAFIKSLRGSDPDAGLYWLAKMVYAGEDPRFIFRRMLILACEDVGLADPHAISVVASCAGAFDRVGLPEGQFHLAHAALYLATAPKSNTSLGFFDALKVVETQREPDIPAHLKDASRDREGFGHGAGYRYPHAFQDHWVAQPYLPQRLQGKMFYQPSSQGYERQIQQAVTARREAQMAAMTEWEDRMPGEILTFTPFGKDLDHWLRRALGNAGETMAGIRERIFEGAPVHRHDVVAVFHAQTGLLVWEALRRAPEGGVYALAPDQNRAAQLQEEAARLPALHRPVVLAGAPEDLASLLKSRGEEALRFDGILGKNLFTARKDKARLARYILEALKPGGWLSLAETLPRHTQRLYALVDPSLLPGDLGSRWMAAEEAIYVAPDDPMVNWDAEDLQQALQGAGIQGLHLQVEDLVTHIPVTPRLLERWFEASPRTVRPSYVEQIQKGLHREDADLIRGLMDQTLRGQTISWTTRMAFVNGHAGPAEEKTL